MLLHRWFIQYNPLYFASALCVLAGVCLLARDPLDWDSGQLSLATVIQLYELALIGGAAFLFDLPGQRRPAAILGIVAMCFLFDVSFRLEALASLGSQTLPAAVAWAMLLAIKLALLARALRVRLPRMHAVAWTIGALALAIAPQLLARNGVERSFVLVGAAWIGIALAALAIWGSPRVQALRPLDDWGHTVLARLQRAMPLVWTGLYWTHIAVWCGVHELALPALSFAPAFALVPFIVRRAAATWVLCAVALVLAARWPAHFALFAGVLAAGLFVRRLDGAAALVALAAAWPAIAPWLPSKLAYWGMILLGGGFAALAVGLALNWRSAAVESAHADLRIRLPRLRP